MGSGLEFCRRSRFSSQKELGYLSPVAFCCLEVKLILPERERTDLAAHPFSVLSRKNLILMGISAIAGLSVFLIWTTAPKPAVLDGKEESWAVTTVSANPTLSSPQITLYD